ncbi:MAG TPA: hypothetical protein VFY13_10240, partial [Luteolibacter sp.]|nr:hypothetical protein [Luteolibacter sp.]
GITQEEYFKIYSNGITWPKLQMMPNNETCYADPNFYGFYCEYDYWENPMGWKTPQEGAERVEKMNKAALRFAEKNYRGERPRFLCYNYITTRQETPEEALNKELEDYYKNRGDETPRERARRARRNKKKQDDTPLDYKPWELYRPQCRWGDPMWPNSKVQVMDGGGGVLTHELGHCLGAPDTYHVGRFNDGIGGNPTPLAYGPTANAFSRFYHHAFFGAANHPTLTKSGTYTLHPRHIKPAGDEALGYLIPSNHPHYFYHVEYIHNENDIVGVGTKVEGMLISVVNLGLTNYLGSPDYFYVYRPGDPFFRSKGDADQCLFGAAHGRTAFNMQTEPSSRLPNLLDGGVSFKNIQEHKGTLTFDLEINRKPVNGSAYTLSMLPQIRLDSVTDVQPTSFTMDCTIKFRGEPLKTSYGFCWSKSPAPTVRNSTYTLCHREHYRGHAIQLEPGTPYHVRAFATNGLGVRYSDEEIVVTTPKLENPPTQIGPLCTDRFSDNDYLYNTFGQENQSSAMEYANYSPICVLAKLIAYYRPANFQSIIEEKKGAVAVNFNQMNWNPDEDTPLHRLDELEGFFLAIKDRSKELELREKPPAKDFIRNLVKLTGVRSKPVLTTLTPENIKEARALIREDIINSRPVIVIFCPKWEGANDLICWGLIDGMDKTGSFRLDLPMKRKFMRDGELVEVKSCHLPASELMIPEYTTHVITSCYFTK